MYLVFFMQSLVVATTDSNAISDISFGLERRQILDYGKHFTVITEVYWGDSDKLRVGIVQTEYIISTLSQKTFMRNEKGHKFLVVSI